MRRRLASRIVLLLTLCGGVSHAADAQNETASGDFRPHEKSFTVENRYLVIPIQNKSPKQAQNKNKPTGKLQLFVDGKEVRRYDLTIASSSETVDWYAFFTIAAYQGQPARVVASHATAAGFDLIRQSDTIPGEEAFYKEPFRPQFHFTQKVGWNNDPNGMVWHDGVWHLFFQHNPVALPWGNMTWGHATSNDLIHWQQQPNKLFPHTMAKGACFSGGATVDRHNTAGWGENTLVAVLTDTDAGESIAYSTDGGETFTWFAGNPVVRHKGRDPKVIWYAYDDRDTPLNETAKNLGGHWVMAVYDEHPEFKKNAAFYTSTNLKDWTEQSHLPGYYECTELFQLPVDGAEGNTRWVVFAADAKYAIGQFDGRTFTPEHEGKHQLHWGQYYASQTFDNPPDGRRIQIGWLKVPAPGPYNQHFSFPHELTLRTTPEGVRMFAEPIAEIEQLRQQTHAAQPAQLAADQPVRLPVGSDLLDAELMIDVGTAKAIELSVAGRTIRYDVAAQRLNEALLAPVDGRITIRVLADRSLTEIIGNDGQVFISGPGPARREPEEITVTARGGTAELLSLDAHELGSIWAQ